MEHSQAEPRTQASEQMKDEKRADNDSRTRKLYSSSISAVQPPKPASARQRWNEYRPSKTLAFWSLLGVVALTMLVGFTWGGWMTSASAQRLADTSAKTAVIQRLAPICVAQFNLDPARDQKLIVLQEGTVYEATKYVTDQTWATLPGDTKPSSQVASECAKLLMQVGK
jgi:hypothetical protein